MLQVSQTQAPATTATAQTITVPTSTMIVQTLTQACASSLAKLRHMFDDDNYEAAYVEFAKPSDEQSLPDANASQTQLKKLQYETLKKGVTERADRLLDLLVRLSLLSHEDMLISRVTGSRSRRCYQARIPEDFAIRHR
jgi:hypothetical protein